MLLDPAIQLHPPALGFGDQPIGFFNMTMYRTDVWPNRKAAIAANKRFMQALDPRCQERMAQYAFRNLPTALYPELPADADSNDPPVTLTTTKHNELLAQFRENFTSRQPDGAIVIDRATHADMDPEASFIPIYRPEPRSTLFKLPTLRPSALWILSGKNFLSLDEIRLGIRTCGQGIGGSGGAPADRVKEVFFADQGHMFPLVVPGETADECAVWIGKEMERYQEERAEWEARRAKMSARDHLVLSEQWIKTVKPPPGVGKAKNKESRAML